MGGESESYQCRDEAKQIFKMATKDGEARQKRLKTETHPLEKDSHPTSIRRRWRRAGGRPSHLAVEGRLELQ